MARQGPPNAQVKQRQHIVHEHAFKGTVPRNYDDTPRRRGEHHQPAFGTSRPPSPGAKIKKEEGKKTKKEGQDGTRTHNLCQLPYTGKQRATIAPPDLDVKKTTT